MCASSCIRERLTVRMRTRDRDDPIPRRRMRNEMERVSVEVVSLVSWHFGSFVRRGSVVRSRHAMRNFPFVTNTGCKIYDDRA